MFSESQNQRESILSTRCTQPSFALNCLAGLMASFWIAFFCDVHYIPFLRQGFSLILLSNLLAAAIFTGVSFRSRSGPRKKSFLEDIHVWAKLVMKGIRMISF
jgi:hypothetical protein